MVEYFIRGALFHDAAGIHDNDVVRHARDDAEVVRDEHDGGVELILQILEQIKNLRLDRNVERGGRLVGDDERGRAGKRDGYHDTLTHTTGQLMRVHGVHALFVGDADKVEHLERARLDLFLAHLGVMEHGDFVDLLADAEHRIQAGHRLLEYHGYLVAANLLHFCSRGVDDVICGAVAEVEADLAADGLTLGALKQLHQGKAGDGFAAAGLADNADGRALGNHEADAVNGLDRADIGEEIGTDVIKLDNVVLVLHLRREQRGILIGVRSVSFELLGYAAVKF